MIKYIKKESILKVILHEKRKMYCVKYSKEIKPFKLLGINLTKRKEEGFYYVSLFSKSIEQPYEGNDAIVIENKVYYKPYIEIFTIDGMSTVKQFENISSLINFIDLYIDKNIFIKL